MRGVCFLDVGHVDWLELAAPQLESPTDAIVRVEVAGMCGSDLHPFFGREKGLDRGTVMGHEFVGTVVDLGSQVHHLQRGERVFAPFTTNCGTCYFCQHGLTSRCTRGQLFGWRSGEMGLHGGQAEFVRVPMADSTLMRVPPEISESAALLLGDNLSTAYFCAEMANVDADSVCVVIGCGCVGLLAIKAVQMRNAGRIIAVERVEARRRMAESLGAITAASDEQASRLVRDITDGRGADQVLELVGLPAAQQLSFELLRPGGTLSAIGCHSAANFAFSPAAAYDKNLTYRTGRCPARHYMQSLAPETVSEMATLTEQLITHRFLPSDCKHAYEVFSQQQDGCIKAIFDFASLT